MKKVFIFLKACSARGVDASKLKEYLLKNKYEVVDKPKKADSIVIFVCMTGTDSGKKASIKSIKNLQKYNAEIIVTGCIPQGKIDFSSLDDKVIFIHNKEFDQRVEELFPPKNNNNFRDIQSINKVFENTIEFIDVSIIIKYLNKVRLFKKIYFSLEEYIFGKFYGKNTEIYNLLSSKKENVFNLLICHGCSGNCSYCLVKKTIGDIKSEPFDKVICGFKEGVKLGYKTFVIRGEDTGAYGTDIGITFPDLLEKIITFPGDYKIIIDDFAPKWLNKYIDDLERIVQKGKIIEFNVPIESASKRILKLMYRDSNVERMENNISRIKKTFPSLKSSTHYILGFPTETWKDFLQTLYFIVKSDFDSGFIFPYYCQPDTDAEKFEPKISEKEKLKRLNYAKKYLEKAGYKVYRNKKKKLFIFEK